MINFVILLYLIAIICCFVVFSKSDFNFKFGLILILMLTVCFLTALRLYTYTPDTTNYVFYFENIQWEYIYDSLFNGKESFCGLENGFLLYTIFFREYICNNIICYFASIFLIELFLTFKALGKWFNNNLKKIICAFAFTLPYFGYFYVLVTIRSGLAFCVALNAFVIPYKSKCNCISKLIVYCLACFIHRSAIILLFIELLTCFLLISSKKIKLFIPLFFLFSLSLKNSFIQKLIMNIFASIFDYLSYGKVLRYLLTYEFRITWGLRDICFYILGFIFLLIRNHVKNDSYDKLFLIFITGLYVANLLSGVNIAYRITDIFWLFTPFMLAEAYNNEKLIRKHKCILGVFSVVYTIMGVTLFIRLAGYWTQFFN